MNEILIVGVGGAGAYLASHFEAVTGYPAVAVNTDKPALEKSDLGQRILIGPNTFRKYGASNPSLGQRAAEESSADLVQMMVNSKVLVLLTGLGGATGTGAAPVIAKLARDRGIRVIAGVTLPFEVETARRAHASVGLIALQRTGVTVIIHDHATANNGGKGMMPIPDSFERTAMTLSEAVTSELMNHALHTAEISPG